MADTVFADDPQTVELLQSMRILMRWLSSVPRGMRQRFLGALAECSEDVQNVVFQMVSVVENPHTTSLERHRALATIADALLSNPNDGGECGPDLAASGAGSEADYASLGGEVQKPDCQEAAFADRLRELMAVRCVTQQELSNRVGCSQPAISQMLNRKSRPQKKTILRLAEALQVQPQELWPDLEVAEILDAVADFQEDDHVMTEAEAKALRDTANRNVSRIPVGPLPTRRRSKGNG
jgi:transcriptional regulator with XRE-family HTH domain